MRLVPRRHGSNFWGQAVSSQSPLVLLSFLGGRRDKSYRQDPHVSGAGVCEKIDCGLPSPRFRISARAI